MARNAAHLVEYEVKDLVRAFRAYLNAFRLAPDDEEIVGAPLAAGDQHRPLSQREICSGRSETMTAEAGRRRDRGVIEPTPQWRRRSASPSWARRRDSDGDGLDVVSEEVDVEVEIDAGEEPARARSSRAPARRLVTPVQAPSQASDATLDDSGALLDNTDKIEEPIC